MITFINKNVKVISFLGKTIQTVEKTSGKRISIKVVWKNLDKKFVAKKDKFYLEIADQDKLLGCKWIYSLPTNTYFSPWHRKPYTPIEDKDKYEMLLRFWGKYWHGQTLYGKIVDGVFRESKHKINEPNISSVTTETISS